MNIDILNILLLSNINNLKINGIRKAYVNKIFYND